MASGSEVCALERSAMSWLALGVTRPLNEQYALYVQRAKL